MSNSERNENFIEEKIENVTKILPRQNVILHRFRGGKRIGIFSRSLAYVGNPPLNTVAAQRKKTQKQYFKYYFLREIDLKNSIFNTISF